MSSTTSAEERKVVLINNLKTKIQVLNEQNSKLRAEIENNNLTDVEKQRKDFARFISQYDERRGTNFEETFPELKYMYNEYK